MAGILCMQIPVYDLSNYVIAFGGTGLCIYCIKSTVDDTKLKQWCFTASAGMDPADDSYWYNEDIDFKWQW